MKHAIYLSCILLVCGCVAKERFPRKSDVRDEPSTIRLVSGGALGMCAVAIENGIARAITTDKEYRVYISAAVAAAIEMLKYKMPYDMPADMQRGFYGFNGIANIVCGFGSSQHDLGWGALPIHAGGAAFSYYMYEPELVWRRDDDGEWYAEIIIKSRRRK